MRIISTTLLGFVDYLVGITLMLPFITGKYPGSIDTNVLFFIGFFIFLNAVHTDYSFSPIKVIPVRLHLLLNVIAVCVLIMSPFLFLFDHYKAWPFALAAGYLLVMLLTDPSAAHKGKGRKWL